MQNNLQAEIAACVSELVSLYLTVEKLRGPGWNDVHI